MRIAIFENEYDAAVRTPFQAVNIIYFNNSLSVENFPSSQAFGKFYKINQYDKVFIDIDLSKNSEMDGFDVAREILKLGYPETRIIILTGHLGIQAKIVEKGLPKLKVVTKPIFLDDLRAALQ
ncbi:response regulator [Pontibacter sp. 172403-2]|uniref:response regulator n=1 Tax=Pontibacter rufus TaxID=2791028 RepID=UPI0018AFD74C|nr:response regulator [Pontibacter sp. 172403-2]MBF9255732.1 response regulator [Pontibacter sp. 172403-2]